MTPIQKVSPLAPISIGNLPLLPNPAVAPILEAGADVNARDTADNTPLHHAAVGDSVLVDVLLAAGADVRARNRSGDTPLHMRAMSVRGNAGPIAASLVRAGADMNARNDEGLTPMQLALRARNAWVVDELLELGADPETLETPERKPRSGMCHLLGRDFLGSATAETLQECIDWGAEVNARDDDGLTPMHRLVRAERPNRAARALIGTLAGAGAEANARDRAGNTPLHPAAEAGRSEMVAALLEAGADVNMRNDDGATPLFLAASAGRLGVATALLAAGANANAATESGRTPLHEAVLARRDPAELVSLLVGAGAIMDARDARGRTPLHDALRAGRPDVFDTLIRLGADPTLPDASGRVPDPTNCGRWNTPVFFRLAGADVVAGCIRRGADVTGDGDGATPLHEASRFTRDPAVISAMVRAGAEVNARDNRGYTPLHLAARHNTDPVIVSVLVKAGAEVNSRASGYHIDYGWDYTPLHEATANPNPAVAAALVEAGARVNAGGWEGTPLHLAAVRACGPALISVLTGAGADPNLRSGGGLTPLHHAVAANSGPDVVVALLEAGADVNARAEAGRTPLHEAAKYAAPDVVAVLLDRGADVNARSEDGATPLHRAASLGQSAAVVEMLVLAGADLQASGKGGRTPLHEAARSSEKYQLLLQLGADPTETDDDGSTPSDYARGKVPQEWLHAVARGHRMVNPCRAAGN